MNRQELIAKIAEKSDTPKSTVDVVLRDFIDTVQEEVAAGEKITLVGFGTFEAVKTAKREGRNPKTGEAITIAASVRPKFSPGSTFKTIVKEA